MAVFCGVAACGGGDSSSGGTTSPSAPPATAPPGTVLGQASEKTIGAAGGTVSTPDGALTIDVPPGALAADTALKIEPIQNTAFGGVGGAYRLSPDGLTFAQPVEVAFRYGDADLDGTSLDAVSIAYQTPDGFWHRYNDVTRDPNGKRVTVPTTHFSDWALVTGARLAPGRASVAVGATLTLTIESCDAEAETPTMGRLAPCTPARADANPTSWAVNGAPGGSPTLGTVSGQSTATYVAPAQPPTPATVDVSVSVTSSSGRRVPLVSHVTVGGGERWVGTLSAETHETVAGANVTTTFTANVTFKANPDLPAAGYFECVGDNFTSHYQLTKVDCSTTGQGGGALGNGPGGPAGALQIFDAGSSLQYSVMVTSTGMMDGQTTCNDDHHVEALTQFQPTGAAGTQAPRPVGPDAKHIQDSFVVPSGAGETTMTINLTLVP